jgi:hypothetical protein
MYSGQGVSVEKDYLRKHGRDCGLGGILGEEQAEEWLCVGMGRTDERWGEGYDAKDDCTGSERRYSTFQVNRDGYWGDP